MHMNVPMHKQGKKEAKGPQMKANPESPQKTGETELFFKEIQSRAETITPVLKQILELRPSPHWGISE